MARTWHLVTAATVGAALLLQLVLVIIEGQPGPPAGLVRLASYFAVQANLFVLVTSVALASGRHRDTLARRVVRLDALIGISVTGAVYLVVLGPIAHLSGWAAVADAGLHYLSPLLMVGGWLMFGPRRQFDLRVVLIAAAWPLAWVAWTLGHGAVAGFYPYPFIDVRAVGYAKAVLNAGFVVVVLFGLGLAAWQLDRRLTAAAPEGWVPWFSRAGRPPRRS